MKKFLFLLILIPFLNPALAQNDAKKAVNKRIIKTMTGRTSFASKPKKVVKALLAPMAGPTPR
jgi:hypothetical protein